MDQIKNRPKGYGDIFDVSKEEKQPNETILKGIF